MPNPKDKPLDEMLKEIDAILEEDGESVANSQPIKYAPTLHDINNEDGEIRWRYCGYVSH